MLKVYIKEVIIVIIEALHDVFRFIRSSGKDTYSYLLNKSKKKSFPQNISYSVFFKLFFRPTKKDQDNFSIKLLT